MASNIPSTPPDIDKLDSLQPVQQRGSENAPEEGKFSSLMNSEPNQVSNQPSPMQVANQANPPSAPPTIASVQAQMNSISGSLGDVKNQLHTKGLKLRQSDKHLLRNKLNSANENIRGAAERTGVNTGPAVDLSSQKNPIAKFLALVTDGQHQMNSAAQQIKDLDSSGKSVNAGQLLLIQAKLQKASQELEFTSIILGKATDMIKTLFNVQI